MRLRHRLILSGTKSSEGVSHANIDVIVLRVAVTFFTFEARVGTPAVGTLPVGGETVIETRAVNGIGFNGFACTVNTTIANGLITHEFMGDAARHRDLEEALVSRRTIVELLAKDNAGTAIEEVGIALFNPEAG